jgi:large subunit ribosomal protein L4
MQKVLESNQIEKTLVVLADNAGKVILSASNIPDVKTTPAELINVYDILKYDTFFTTKDAVSKIEEVFA